MRGAEVPRAARTRAVAQAHVFGPGDAQAAWAENGQPRAERPDDVAVVLRWAPTVPHPRTPIAAPAARPGGRGMPMPTLMCVDGHRDIPRGASAYLLLTGWASGLIARGSLLCAPFLAARPDRPGTVGQHVVVAWTEVLGLADRIPLEILQAELPEAGWLAVTREASAVPLTGGLSELVHRLWHVWMDRGNAGSGASWAVTRSDGSE